MAGLWKIVLLATITLMCVTSHWVIYVQAEEASSSDDMVNSASETDPGMDGEEDLKRANTFLRIGKANGILRLARSPSSFLRIGRAPQSHFVRIGKAPSSMFLRIGKRMDDSEDVDLSEYDADNKMAGRDTRASPSSFLRIGKSANDVDDDGDDSDETVKRVKAYLRKQGPSSFLRIGRSMNNDAISNDKRTNAFLRIGKIPASSFIRLGRGPFAEDNGINTRAFRGPTQGFLRIGKREAIPNGSHGSYFSDLNVKSQ